MASPEQQAQAAAMLVRLFRNKIAKISYAHLSTGKKWKEDRADPTMSGIRALSRANKQKLYTSLAFPALTHEEKEFLHKFLAVSFFATHATRVNSPLGSTLELFSRQKLITRNKSFNTSNSPPEDIALLGNDDFVFFSLEVGAAPKKTDSRFGDVCYRVNFRHSIFVDYSWLSLVEMRFAQTPEVCRHLMLPPEDLKILSRRKLFPSTNIVFFGKDMIIGIALSILKDARLLSKDGQRRILSMLSEDDLNKIVNGFYRPEIKVPRHFFSRDYERVTLSPKLVSKL